ncbi:hypothetical protein RHMOL_Rhmol12G0087600 [Rhododendron molle]|uniref:Uncharacterized protein n=1 Tax=Rhododendron molle TaxID=49168 RepID=A0ACC0LGU6_RHOML|nr:hypothetical protein RHMOL_Rhmol12G0087600 [Rhododendron molle]
MAASKPIFLFLFLILISSCAATRPGGMMILEGGLIKVSEHLRRLNGEGYFRQGLVFNMLPKGIPISPSGPSKRHN